MKKLLISLVVILFVSFLYPAKTNAQEIKLGGGLIIETDSPPLGLQFKGTYGLDMLLENLSGSVEFGIFLPKTTASYKYTRWGLDIDGNYTFWNMGDFNFYAVGGLNISSYSSKYTGPYTGPYYDDLDVTGTKPGLNLGAGVNFGFSANMSAYSEVKYILSNYDVAVINFGVLFTL